MTSYNVQKLYRLQIDAEVCEAKGGTYSALVNDARDRCSDNHRQLVRQRERLQADHPLKRATPGELAALPDDRLREIGVDVLSVRRAAAADARLASLIAEQAAHAQRTAALKTLVKRLQAWAGGQLGEAVGLGPASLGVTIDRGQAA